MNFMSDTAYSSAQSKDFETLRQTIRNSPEMQKKYVECLKQLPKQLYEKKQYLAVANIFEELFFPELGSFADNSFSICDALLSTTLMIS